MPSTTGLKFCRGSETDPATRAPNPAGFPCEHEFHDHSHVERLIRAEPPSVLELHGGAEERLAIAIPIDKARIAAGQRAQRLLDHERVGMRRPAGWRHERP